MICIRCPKGIHINRKLERISFWVVIPQYGHGQPQEATAWWLSLPAGTKSLYAATPVWQDFNIF